jgi:hypothetical protein
VAGEGGVHLAQVGVVETGADDGGLQVVVAHQPGHAPEGLEGTLVGPQEAVSVLLLHGLLVAVAGAGEGHPEDPGAPPLLSLPVEGGRPPEEVHLGLLPRRMLQNVGHLRPLLPAPPDEALHRGVAVAVALLLPQVLGSSPPTRPDPNNPGSFLDSPERHAVALSVPVGETGPAGSFNLAQETPAPGPRHNFGDTKHRTVSYLPRAYSRFDDFFRMSAPVDFGVANPAQVDANGVVHGSVRLTASVNTSEGARTIAWTEGIDFSVDAAAGTVTKLNSALPDQAQASWVPRPNDREGQPVTLEVPSSSRPDPPKVLYIIPTFS